MALSSDLIAQFVKVTNDSTKPEGEVTVYGTITEYEGKNFVKLDGSELLTPITTTTAVKPGERVTVMIKNHTATVTGNITSPSAQDRDVSSAASKISEFEIAIGYRVVAEELDAVNATIDSLKAKVAKFGDVTAINADIESLRAEYASLDRVYAKDVEMLNAYVENIRAKFGNFIDISVEDLDAMNADIDQLKAYNADFTYVSADVLKALKGQIDNLDVGDLSAIHAKIEELEANQADISNLTADVADIETLIFGSASGDVIHTSFANSVIAQLGEAQIKSAMIESVAADKITAGDIITNNVRVLSEDGKLLISDETIQISDNTRVRVQIGKDAANDYSINIWDADGNLMFSKGGITDSAIKDAIIRNDMVSDTANISAHKLDIDSLFEEINGSTNTIKSTRVYLDEQNQSLDVAFKAMTTDMTELGETVSSQGTAISTVQGQISSKIWQQDIDTATGEMSTQYSALDQKIDGVSATVANHATEINKKADSTTVTKVTDRVSTLETGLSGFRTTVRDTYTTKAEFDDLTIGGRNYFVKSQMNNLAWGSADSEHPHGKILEAERYRGFSFRVSDGDQWCLYRTDTTNNRWGVYWFAEEPALDIGAIGSSFRSDSQAANVVNHLTVPTGAAWGFIYLSNDISEGDIPNVMLEKSTKASDWTPAPEDVDSDILAVQDEVVLLEERIAEAETTIFQNTEAIGMKASKTEVTTAKTEAIAAASTDAQEKANKALSDANANTSSLLTNYSTTAQMQAAITASADSITSSVKNTYATIKTVEGIEVGGRNYFRPSNVVDLGCTGMASGEHALIGTGSCVSFYVPTVAGEVWTLSRSATENNRFDYCFTIDEPAANVPIYNWNSDHRNDLEIVGITVPEGYNYLFVYLSNQNDDIPNIKLEKGNKVTDWSPAPEDMATSDELSNVQSSADLVEERVTTTESLIQQLSHSIMTLVTDSNGESLMVQNGDGWTFSTEQIQTAINNTSENLNKLTDDMDDVNTAVDALKTAVDDLGILNDYVKIGTYENEPCIELGESDSDFKLLITNTRIMFMEGSGMPAYINNQSLYIKKAVVEEELQQGEFVWKSRSNGNLGLIWKGVTS